MFYDFNFVNMRIRICYLYLFFYICIYICDVFLYMYVVEKLSLSGYFFFRVDGLVLFRGIYSYCSVCIEVFVFCLKVFGY